MPSKKAATMTKAQKKSKPQHKAPPPKPVESGSEDDSEEEEEMDVSPAHAKNCTAPSQKRKAEKARVKASKKAKKAAPPKVLSDAKSSEEEEDPPADSSEKEKDPPADSTKSDKESSDKEDDNDDDEGDDDNDDRNEETGTKPAATKADKELFVKNLPYHIKTPKLISMLKQEFTGSVEIRIPGHNKGYAFVEFNSSAEVDNALKNKQGVELGGRSLFLDGTGKKPKLIGNRLYVGNLTRGYSDDEMKRLLMKHFSNPKEIRLPRSSSSRFALVEFSSSADLDTALNELQGSELNGCALFLRRARRE